MERKSISRFAVFITLAIGFLALGLTGAYIIYTGARETYYAQVARNLKSIAELTALQMDAQAIESLTEPNQTSTPEFISQTQKLEDIIQNSEQITHISVLKTIGPQYHFVVDASTLGQDGSKSQLLDPAEEIPTDLIRAVTNKKATSSIIPHTDRWGTWYSAFAPIINSAGEVVAVVNVDASSDSVDLGDQDILLRYRVTLGIAIVACLALAWLASGPVASGLSTVAIWSNTPYRRAIIEGVIVLAILGLGFEVGLSFTRQNALNQGAKHLALSQSAVQELNQVTHNLRSGYRSSKQDLTQLKKSLQATGHGQAYDFIAKINEQPESNSSTFESLFNTTVSISKDINDLTNQNADLQQAQSNSNIRILFGVILLSLSTVLLARYSSNLDRTINKTVVDSNSIQAQLSSLVENLPVGMFVLENKGISFTNAEWKFQIGVTETPNNFETLSKSIHPDDRESVMEMITTSAKEATPFDIQYRIVKPNAPVLHVETRGVPVYDNDGICRRMIAFTIDFSAAVEAKSALEGAYREVEHKNRLLADALGELEHNLESVVKALVKAVEAKDPYTAGHSERVMQYSLWLGEAIGLGPYEQRILELGTLVHDVGKIGIPDAILTKPDKLTDEEYDIIKKHPEYGVNIIGSIEMFKECLPIVRWHHERLDGKGYPDGLKGDELSILVRISAIADIFDAMTSTRAYRTGMDLDKVLEIMNGLAERQEIDPELFSTFCQVVHTRGIIPQQVLQEPWKAA